MADGVALLTWEQDSFAYADGYDEATGRYQGLRVATQVRLSPEAPQGVLVKPEVALRQLEKEVVPPGPGPKPPDGEGKVEGPGTTPPPPKPVLRRFHGSVTLDPVRAGADECVPSLVDFGSAPVGALRCPPVRLLPCGSPQGSS